MTVCQNSLSVSSRRCTLLPAQPNWLFIIIGMAISLMVAGKSYGQDGNYYGRKVSSEVGKNAKKKSRVGRKAAEKYMSKEADDDGSSEEVEDRPARRRSYSKDHYMALYIGKLFNSETFSWGSTNVDDAGELNIGVTYRFGEWTKSMDMLFRAEWQSYSLPEGDASKLSFMPVIQFPEASSEFPLYFGAGVGLGIFTKQISDETNFSLDYQLFGGARWFNLYRSVGVMAEFGLKNHFHIFTSGQFNSLSFSVGSVFTF